ncbi:hypothetical protein BH11PSE1_BH11PSE1_16850 [soil metagenome]
MAYIANPAMIERGNPAAFHTVHHPGEATPFSGIYRCLSCGLEAVSTKGHPLPPQHFRHRHPLPIHWQLVAASRHA